MGKSRRVVTKDLVDTVRLLAEVAALPPQGTARCRRMLQGMSELTRAAAGVCVDLVLDAVQHRLLLRRAQTVGLELWQETTIDRYKACGEPGDPRRELVLRQQTALRTYLDDELIPLRQWRLSAHYNEVRLPAGMDRFLYSAMKLPEPEAYWVLVMYRRPGDKCFGERERQLLHLLHQHATYLCHPPRHVNPLLAQLPLRLKRILPLLLEGLSTKEVAVRLGYSQHTVHEYTKVLYRQLAVSTRVELLVRCQAAGALPSAGVCCGGMVQMLPVTKPSEPG